LELLTIAVAPTRENLMQRLRRGLISLALGLAVAACGGGGGEATPISGLLTGDPTSPALAALTDKAPEPAAAVDIDNRLILTRLEVVLAADATVDQVNSALTLVGATVSSMRAGLPAFTVAIPRQAGADALQALAAKLRAQPGVAAVLSAQEAGVSLAPPTPADSGANFAYLHNAHFPAAWNARGAASGFCAGNKITVIVPDYFHRPIDALYSQFAAQVPGVTELGSGSVAAANPIGFHGYDVLTTLAAKLDATAPTGANPFSECLDLKALQLTSLGSLDISLAIDAAVAATTGNVVVNASWGFGDDCGDPCTPAQLISPTAFDRAVRGATQRRLLQPIEARTLVVSAAGNEAGTPVASVYPGAGQARVGASFNVAATADSAMSFVSESALWEPAVVCATAPCFPSLTATPSDVAALAGVLASLGQTSAPLAANVIIAGSIDNSFVVSTFSEPGATLLAVGEDVPTLLGVPTKGTSVAAPQLSALAAYLWMLSPELRTRPVRDTIAAINANADPTGIVNAYATVLSLDQPVAVTPSTARVRLAILDLDGDGDFDLDDLRAFHAAYVDSGLVLEPGTQDFSRFDLNGDGFTGGGRATSMDLDPDGSTRFGAPVLSEVFVTIGGIERVFDERRITDLQALCFYAHSDLYTGDTAARNALLGGLCSDVTVSVQPGAVSLAPGATQQFAANVIGSADVDVAWTATGGTITATGLFTAGATPGNFRVRAISVADPAAFGDATVTVTGGSTADILVLGRTSRATASVVATVDSGSSPNADQKNGEQRSIDRDEATTFDVDLMAQRDDGPESARAAARVKEESDPVLGNGGNLMSFAGKFSVLVSASASPRDDLTDPVGFASADLVSILQFRVRVNAVAYALVIAVNPGATNLSCRLQGGPPNRSVFIDASSSGTLEPGDYEMFCGGGAQAHALPTDSPKEVTGNGDFSLSFGAP
jgi:hypothetical protein